MVECHSKAESITPKWRQVDGEMDIASQGVSWWLTPFYSVGANYRYLRSTRLGVEGKSSGFNTRLIFLHE